MLAKWLMRYIGQMSADKFLKLSIVSFVTEVRKKKKLTVKYQINSKENLSFHNSYLFLIKIDKLPIGPK